jgi:signal transduction histidine kinase
VYFSCLEALQEAGRHAGPEARATVRVWPEQGALLFEVVLDGAASKPCETPLTNMNDRLGAVGGRLSASSEPGRTLVLGTIPLAQ